MMTWHRRLVAIATLVGLVFYGQSVFALPAHPRLWLTPQVLGTVSAKQLASDPDWLTLKATADRLLAVVPPRLTIVAATTTSPVQFTAATSLPFAGSTVLYLAGATGAWASLNNLPPAGAWVATQTGPTTFTIPVDVAAFGVFTGQRLTAFAYGSEAPGFLSYGQTGDQWADAATSLALAYRQTGVVAYRDKALQFLDWWNELGAANMTAPVSQDSGRGAFSVPPAVAYVYDWLYPSLSATQKTASVLTLNRWCTWIDANGYGRHDPTSNFWEANQIAFLMTGYATFDENAQAQTWIDKASADWQADLVPMFQPPQVGTQTYGQKAGFYYTGMAVSGFNYGGNDIQRHVQRLFLVKSATGIDVPNAVEYAKRWARNLLYQLKPDRWKAAVFGQWTGSMTGVMKVNDAIQLSAYLAGTTEGAWMQWYLQHSGVNAPGIPVDARGFVADSTNYKDRLLNYDATRPVTDYTATEPPYLFSDGGEAHLIWRSGWTATDDYAYFQAVPGFYSASHNKQAGHVDLTRGTDYLLVQASWWKGVDGLSGSPDNSDPSSAFSNTLYFDAPGCFNQSYPYAGCQLLYGRYLTPKVKLTRDYAFGENEFASMYDATGGSPSRPLQYFFRSFVALGDGEYVVWDRIQSTSASHMKQLRWQFGTGTTPIVSGNRVLSTVGGSLLALVTLLPSSPVIAVNRNTVNGQPLNWRADVSDASPAPTFTGLTVLSALPAASAAPAVALLTTIDPGFVGLQVGGVAPKVAVLPRTVLTSSAGVYVSATSASVSFATTHAGTARYVVAGLTAGAYTVARNTSALTTATVDGNGVLSFTANAGTFAIAATGTPAPLPTPSPVVVVTSPTPASDCTAGITLTADILLGSSDTFEWIGTPTARCQVQANGHRIMVDGGGSWTGHLTIDYADVTGLGTATLWGIGDNGGASYAYLNGAQVSIQHSTFHVGGGFNFFTVNNGSITFSDNIYAADNLVLAGGQAAQAASWFNEQGSSTAVKYFQGNQAFRAYATFGSPNWTVGAAAGCTTGCDADGNLFIGRRVGFGIAGTGSYASYNYTHVNVDVTPQEDFWSQVGAVGPIGTGALAEHNIFRTGHWVASSVDGELRNNVLLEAHGHDFIRIGNGGVVRGNILLAKYPGFDRYSNGVNFFTVPSVFGIYQIGNSLLFRNNTVDARNLSVRGATVIAGATISYRNNVFYQSTLAADNCPSGGNCTSLLMRDFSEAYITPPPNRSLYQDYNDSFFDVASPRTSVYDLGVAGKTLGDPGYGLHDLGLLNGQGLDPQLRGPLPIGSSPLGLGSPDYAGFPFNDADILSGIYPVSAMLSYFRWVYAPGPTSPLVGAQDPQDGLGDGGAVQIMSLPNTAPEIVATNKRPMVTAGPSFAVSGSIAKLSGYGADDGLPSRRLTFTWAKVSGPGTVTFDDPQKSIATATVSADGTYVLSLTASDSASSSSANATITFGSGQVAPLVLSVSPNITTASPNGQPIVVTYLAPTATGGTLPYVGPTCTPASGSLFAVGTTTVSCTVSDSSAPVQTITGTFTVTVTYAPPPNPCVTDPLVPTVSKWPTGQTGSRAGTWNSGTKTLVSAQFVWTPSLRFIATDTRNCVATVMKP